MNDNVECINGEIAALAQAAEAGAGSAAQELGDRYRKESEYRRIMRRHCTGMGWVPS
jgi:hypothetical protein